MSLQQRLWSTSVRVFRPPPANGAVSRVQVDPIWSPSGPAVVTRPHLSFPDHLRRLLAVANARVYHHYAAETLRRNLRDQMEGCVTWNQLWGGCMVPGAGRVALARPGCASSFYNSFCCAHVR